MPDDEDFAPLPEPAPTFTDAELQRLVDEADAIVEEIDRFLAGD